MAIDLLNLEPQKISRNLKGKFAMIYGDAGCGKTTFASKFEKALLVGFECGSNALNNVYVAPVKTWQDWKRMAKDLATKEQLKDKFYNLCIDTIDEAYKLCEKYVCNQYGVETIKDVAGYGGGWKILDTEFMDGFRQLAFAGYGLIFISHAKEKTLEKDNGEEYTRIVPALPDRPYNLINKMVDLTGYIREIPTQNSKGETERKRFMFFRGDDRFAAKSRFAYITPRIELNYESFVNAIYDAIDKEIEKTGGTATNEENPYFEMNFDELMEEAKALWIKLTGENKIEQASKILEKEFGKPTKFSEILPEQIGQLNKVLIEIKEII